MMTQPEAQTFICVTTVPRLKRLAMDLSSMSRILVSTYLYVCMARRNHGLRHYINSTSMLFFLIEFPYLVDCAWGDFGDWGDCSATCGDGERSRTRIIATPASGNGAECTGDATETETCNEGECPGG